MKWLSLLAVPALCPNLRGTTAAPLGQHGQSILTEADTGADHVAQRLRDSSIIPDVLPEEFVPSFDLSVVYTSSREAVTLGNTIPVKSTSSRPVFQAVPFETPSLTPTRTLAENKTYTLVLSDPDATSRSNPTKGEMAHWILTGINVNQANKTEGIEEGDGVGYALDMRSMSHAGPDGEAVLTELIEYMAPAPPKKTGKHRYIFVLLEPDEGHQGSKENLQAPSERPHFGYGKKGKGVMDWAEDNHLHPVGANFFYAQHKKQ